MVFSIQRFIEDYLNKRGINDVDQYSVALANLFDECRFEVTEEVFLQRMARIRTPLFKKNPSLKRGQFESQLLTRLDSKFKKKVNAANSFSGGLTSEAKRFRAKRRTIQRLLAEYKAAVESKAVDGFWDSRTKHKLKKGPESIAQGLLAVFAKAVVGTNGLVCREALSGIGYIDVGISFGSQWHLIELKILDGDLIGDEQLSTYMKTEGRSEGWLVLIDARKIADKDPIPKSLTVSSGTIHVVVVYINPVAPSKK
jgi:hypothetical protein